MIDSGDDKRTLRSFGRSYVLGQRPFDQGTKPLVAWVTEGNLIAASENVDLCQ